MGKRVEQEYFTISEVCTILGIGRSTVVKWIKDGVMNACIIGKTIRIERSAIQALVKPYNGEALREDNLRGAL